MNRWAVGWCVVAAVMLSACGGGEAELGTTTSDAAPTTDPPPAMTATAGDPAPVATTAGSPTTDPSPSVAATTAGEPASTPSSSAAHAQPSTDRFVCPSNDVASSVVGAPVVLTNSVDTTIGSLFYCEYEAEDAGAFSSLMVSVVQNDDTVDLLAACWADTPGTPPAESDGVAWWDWYSSPVGCGDAKVYEQPFMFSQAGSYARNDNFVCTSMAIVGPSVATPELLGAAMAFTQQTAEGMCDDLGALTALAAGTTETQLFDCAAFNEDAVEALFEEASIAGVSGWSHDPEPPRVEPLYQAAHGCVSYLFDASSDEFLEPGVYMLVGYGRADTTPQNMIERCEGVGCEYSSEMSLLGTEPSLDNRFAFCWSSGDGSLQMARVEARNGLEMSDGELTHACELVLDGVFG